MEDRRLLDAYTRLKEDGLRNLLLELDVGGEVLSQDEDLQKYITPEVRIGELEIKQLLIGEVFSEVLVNLGMREATGNEGRKPEE